MSSRLLGNTLVMFISILYIATAADTTNALPCNQDEVTCQSIFTQCSKEVSNPSRIMNP